MIKVQRQIFLELRRILLYEACTAKSPRKAYGLREANSVIALFCSTTFRANSKCNGVASSRCGKNSTHFKRYHISAVPVLVTVL
ncbi:hypothetical protein D918_07122 [Trichuris suis]|nr:hypothetical protein D918_07122 [Trichuris suis]